MGRGIVLIEQAWLMCRAMRMSVHVEEGAGYAPAELLVRQELHC